MKKVLLTFSLCFACLQFCAVSTMAQSNPLRQKIDLVFANINKSQVPTGFLEEFGNPLIPLDVFNGVLTDSNKVNIDVWRRAYTVLYTSRIYGANPLPPLTSVNTSMDNAEATHNTLAYVNDPAAETGSIPMAMLNVPYNYLRPDAITANLLRAQNNQLYDVAGRTQSPYYSRTCFAAAPTTGYARGGVVSVVFKPELFYNTSGKTVSALSVDFADGRGYLSASWNTPIASNYSTPGSKQIKIRVIFTDGSLAECFSLLEITEVGNNTAQARYAGTAIKVPLTGNIGHSGGTLYIEYDENDGERTLNKPLIVIEGFDAHKAAPLLKKYNYSLQSFINQVRFEPTGYGFEYRLNDIAGYDLVFLDYRYGTDDIKRNAALVKEVIAWVNANKVGNEPNVVMGISMGGLVARYALADMTKQGINTQTRLLITHDSPHRGANTPLGIQYLTRQLADINLVEALNTMWALPELRQAVRLLDEPATQQLSITRVTESGGIAYNTFLDGEYRSMITFPASGPQPAYRTIATSLGSECGQQNLPPYTELLRISGNFFISPVPWIVRSKYNTEIIVNALPAYGQSKRISQVRIWANYRLLIVISVSADLTNKQAYSPANLQPWDSAPGGGQSVKSQAGDLPYNNERRLPFLDLTIGSTYHPGTFCFVPTVSALDATSMDAAVINRPFVEGVSPSNPSRMATFIAQERVNGSTFNEIHPRFTARNAQWLFSEMQNIPHNLTCSAECQTAYPSPLGPNVVCPESGGTFQFVGVPSNTNVTWSLQPSGEYVATSGTGSVAFVQPIGNYNGGSAITFKLTGGCGSQQTFNIPFWVGKPISNFSGPGGSVYPGQVYDYIASTSDGSYSFAWNLYPQNGGPSSNLIWAGGTNDRITIWWGENGYIELTSTNGCGAGPTRRVDVAMDGGMCDPCQRKKASEKPVANDISEQDIAECVAAYPNPSANVFVIRLRSDVEIGSGLPIMIYDANGRLVKSQIARDRMFEIDLKGHSTGLYLLTIELLDAPLNLRLQKN